MSGKRIEWVRPARKRRVPPRERPAEPDIEIGVEYLACRCVRDRPDPACVYCEGTGVVFIDRRPGACLTCVGNGVLFTWQAGNAHRKTCYACNGTGKYPIL